MPPCNVPIGFECRSRRASMRNIAFPSSTRTGSKPISSATGGGSFIGNPSTVSPLKALSMSARIFTVFLLPALAGQLGFPTPAQRLVEGDQVLGDAALALDESVLRCVERSLCVENAQKIDEIGRASCRERV